MGNITKIGTAVLGAIATLACLATVGIIGYSLTDHNEKDNIKKQKADEQIEISETVDVLSADKSGIDNLEIKNLSKSIPPVSDVTPTPLHTHDYVESIDIKATCYQEGRLKYECSICGDTYYTDLPIVQHYATPEWAIKREPTPELVGLRVKYCIYCDEIVAIEDIPYGASGDSGKNVPADGKHVHEYTSAIEREATCILAGLRKYTCSCGAFYTEPISAPGHVASDWTTVEEPTTTRLGRQQITCKVCGVIIDSRPLPVKEASASPSSSAAANATQTPAQTSAPVSPTTNPPAPTQAPNPTSVPSAAPKPTAVPTPTKAPTPKPTATPRTTPTPTIKPTPTAKPTSSPADKVYRLNETWKVDGQWELTFNKVETTDDRNQFSDKKPAQVLIVDYTYKNLGYEDDYMDGLFISINASAQIVDSDGAIGYGYPATITDLPESIPVGSYCNTQAAIGIDHKSTEIKIIMNEYDGKGNKQRATFILPITESVPTATPSPDTQIDYQRGDMTFYTYLGDNGEKHYCLIQPIINTGSKPIYLKTGSIILTDAKGNKVALRNNGHLQSFTDVVMPGKTGYFHNTYGGSLDGYFEPFTPEIILEIYESKNSEVVYPVSGIEIYKGKNGNPVITGKVTNNTSVDNPRFYINVIFRDKNGVVIGMTGDDSDVGSGLGLLIPAGGTKEFALDRRWESITGNFKYEDIDTNNIEVIASGRYSQR